MNKTNKCKTIKLIKLRLAQISKASTKILINPFKIEGKSSYNVQIKKEKKIRKKKSAW